MLKTTFNLNCPWKILSFSFFLALSTVSHLQAMEEDQAVSEPKFFKSPTTVSCSLPFMVSFHHEDELETPQIGGYAEKIARRLFRKYALLNDRGVDCFRSGDPAGNGFDFFMVDSKNRTLLLLEVKGQSISDTAARKGRAAGMVEATAVEKRKKEIILLQKDLSSLDEIKNAMKRRLDGTQLSRAWCHQSLELRKIEDYSDSKKFETARTFKDIIDMLEKESPHKFRFLRLCSMTYVNLTCSAMPTTTYYSLVRDGDSDVPYRADDLGLLERTTNGGLSRYFLQTSEMNEQDANTYIRTIYESVHELRYPIHWIEPRESTTRAIIPSPFPKPIPPKRKNVELKGSAAKVSKSQEPIATEENLEKSELSQDLLSPRAMIVPQSLQENSNPSKTSPLLMAPALPSKEGPLPSHQESLQLSPIQRDLDETEEDPTATEEPFKRDEKAPVVRVIVRSVLKKYLSDTNLENCLADLEKRTKGRASREKNAALLALRILKNEELLKTDQDIIRELNDKVDIEVFLKKEKMAQISDISDWIKPVRAPKKSEEALQNPLNASS